MYTKRITGKGSPLLMLHGWGQSHKSLLPLAKLLSPITTPHLVDLPGFGLSPKPQTCWSAFDYADAMIHYLDSKKITSCTLLGHSFGGKVAMCAAIRYPHRVKHLILLAASGLRPKRTLKHRFLRLGIKLLKSYDALARTNLFTKYFAPRFGSKDYQQAGEMRPILVRSVNEDLTTEVPKIQCPTLILWGKQDTETPFEMGLRLSHLIPHAKFVALPHHGHQLIEDVGAHLCAQFTRSFLQGELS